MYSKYLAALPSAAACVPVSLCHARHFPCVCACMQLHKYQQQVQLLEQLLQAFHGHSPGTPCLPLMTSTPKPLPTTQPINSPMPSASPPAIMQGMNISPTAAVGTPSHAMAQQQLQQLPPTPQQQQLAPPQQQPLPPPSFPSQYAVQPPLADGMQPQAVAAGAGTSEAHPTNMSDSAALASTSSPGIAPTAAPNVLDAAAAPHAGIVTVENTSGPTAPSHEVHISITVPPEPGSITVGSPPIVARSPASVLPTPSANAVMSPSTHGQPNPLQLPSAAVPSALVHVPPPINIMSPQHAAHQHALAQQQGLVPPPALTPLPIALPSPAAAINPQGNAPSLQQILQAIGQSTSNVAALRVACKMAEDQVETSHRHLVDRDRAMKYMQEQIERFQAINNEVTNKLREQELKTIDEHFKLEHSYKQVLMFQQLKDEQSVIIAGYEEKLKVFEQLLNVADVRATQSEETLAELLYELKTLRTSNQILQNSFNHVLRQYETAVDNNALLSKDFASLQNKYDQLCAAGAGGANNTATNLPLELHNSLSSNSLCTTPSAAQDSPHVLTSLASPSSLFHNDPASSFTVPMTPPALQTSLSMTSPLANAHSSSSAQRLHHAYLSAFAENAELRKQLLDKVAIQTRMQIALTQLSKYAARQQQQQQEAAPSPTANSQQDTLHAGTAADAMDIDAAPHTHQVKGNHIASHSHTGNGIVQ